MVNSVRDVKRTIEIAGFCHCVCAADAGHYCRIERIDWVGTSHETTRTACVCFLLGDNLLVSGFLSEVTMPLRRLSRCRTFWHVDVVFVLF